jgi:hypothetical protein
MTKLTVIYATLQDAVGRKREGWTVIENGMFGVPFPTKEQAITQAESIAVIRGQSPSIVRVVTHTTFNQLIGR